MDNLTLKNIDLQFCSDWLKEKIIELIKERDLLKIQIDKCSECGKIKK